MMAGLEVVVVECDDQGNVDLADLEAKAAGHAATLAALMVTYPSTHGVFETAIRDICRVVHDHGGQVYMDGANLNALLGVCRPGEIGPRRRPHEPAQDVLHPARRRRAGGRPDRRRRPPGTLSAQPSPGRRSRTGERHRRHLGGALGLRRHPAHLVGLHRADGGRWD